MNATSIQIPEVSCYYLDPDPVTGELTKIYEVQSNICIHATMIRVPEVSCYYLDGLTRNTLFVFLRVRHGNT